MVITQIEQFIRLNPGSAGVEGTENTISRRFITWAALDAIGTQHSQTKSSKVSEYGCAKVRDSTPALVCC